MDNSSQLTDCNNTIVTDQQGYPDAGLQTTTETSAEQKRYLSLQEWIGNQPGKEWREASERLTQWTDEHLVNRNDVYRLFKSPERRYFGQLITYTAPWFEDARVYGSLDCNVIEGHYRGDDPGKLIGLHAISIENTSRWFVIDVDQHGEDGPVLCEANLKAALGWYEDLQLLGFHPLLLDSNGAGGFHVLVCLSEDVPSQTVHAFVTEFVQNFADYGLKKAPDVFPGEPEVDAYRPYGSWWRLPGQHHTRDHWSKVWDGERWLEDREAIEAILSVTGDSPELIPGLVSTESAGQHVGDLAQFASFLLGERIDPEVVAEVCLLWDDVHNQPPSDEEHIRQTVRDLVRRGQSR